MHRRYGVLVFLAVCVVVAMVVAARRGPTADVRVDHVDQNGACLVDLSTGERRCWAFSVEFPDTLGLHEGECVRAAWAYDADVPPHIERITCPTGA